MERGKHLDKHIYICISDSFPDIEGYRTAFMEMINKLDTDKYQSVITDQGVMQDKGLLFVSFTFIPREK